MTIQAAVIKAYEEGGYPNLHYLDTATEGAGQYRILLDPAFWQALGKSMGWKKNKGCQCCNQVECNYSTIGCPWYKTEEYIYHWHRFIDHLAKGHSPESFFDTL